MDWVSVRGKGLEAVKKYRYVLLVLLAGILLMCLPEGKEEEGPPSTPAVSEKKELQTALAEILSKSAGAGRVEVLLTEAEGEQTVYQMDEDRAAGETTTDLRRDTVLVRDGGQGESGLIRRVDPPAYQGAVVLCQGADNPAVKLSLVEAVASATGLTTDKITVLKMK